MDAQNIPPLGRFNYTPHAHQCPNRRCGFIWAHDPNEIQDETEEIFDAAHKCPQCGTPSITTYEGTRKPAAINDGMYVQPLPRTARIQYVEEEDETRPRPEAYTRAALLRALGFR